MFAYPRRPLDVVGEDHREAPALGPVRDHRHPLGAPLLESCAHLELAPIDEPWLDRPAGELDPGLASCVEAPHGNLQATRK